MPKRPIRLRHGLTLTELLVVVSIMVMVAAAIVPLLQPILSGQNTREAARQLNVMIAGAQAQAIALGRPVGIWLERSMHEPDSAPEGWYTVYKVFEATEPAPYTGDLYEARVVIEGPDPNSGLWLATFQPPGSGAGAITQVKAGDTIRFNRRGPRYAIRDVVMDSNGPAAIAFDVPSINSPAEIPMLTPAKYGAAYAGYPIPVTFEIFRQPVKSASAPIELPNNTAIDLSLSGYVNPSSLTSLTSFREISPRYNVPLYDIAIMFSPKGGIDRICYIAHEPGFPTESFTPPGNISLLIGRDNKIGRDLQGNPLPLQRGVASGDPQAEAQSVTTAIANNAQSLLGIANLAENTNLWLTISNHSGGVQTGANAGLSPATLQTVNPSLDARSLVPEARRLADTGQTIGGR